MNVAIIGSGPAALMTADVLSQNKIHVTVFEKRKSAGRKLLVAGSSGLNITNAIPVEIFTTFYTGPESAWKSWIEGFTPAQWIEFIEKMGISTFKGTSNRYFIEDMKAAVFLKTWLLKLKNQGVEFEYDQECIDFNKLGNSIELTFKNLIKKQFDAAFFALGGGSWEPDEKPLRWPSMFVSKGIVFNEFLASNVGYKVKWPEAFLKESEGKPLKRIVCTSKRGSRSGDAMITSYGVEGTPVYFTGCTGVIEIDLKPDMTEEKILERLKSSKENLSPLRRIKKYLSICDVSQSLLFHLTDSGTKNDLQKLIQKLKHFPLELLDPQPIDEAISSSGGVDLNEIYPHSMTLKKYPGIFLGGEMLDWDAPTGGFLIQACVSQGFAAANGIMNYLKIDRDLK